MLDYEEILKLLKRAKQGDEDAKNLIIEHNSPLVKSIVRRYKNKGVEYDDLYQLGCVGMAKAINNFDESFGVKFSTYAVPMIAGEIKRFLRDDGAIKVSRSIKAQYYNIQKYIDEYKKNNNSAPTPKEIAEQFEIDETELMFIMESSKMPISIYEQVDKDATSSNAQLLLDKIASTSEQQDDIITKMALKDIIKNLDKQDRLLIILRYYRDKTQSEIASIMKVSQVQVSRLETRILNKLKNKLKE